MTNNNFKRSLLTGASAVIMAMSATAVNAASVTLTSTIAATDSTQTNAADSYTIDTTAITIVAGKTVKSHATPTADVVSIDADSGNLTVNGTLLSQNAATTIDTISTSAANADWLLTVGSAGVITQTGDTLGINLDHNIAGISNAGTINVVTNGIGIDVATGLTLSSGIVNTNKITIDAGTGTAIKFAGTASVDGSNASVLLNNSGTISAVASAAGTIDIDGDLTGAITNSGSISTTGAGLTIDVATGADVSGGITNSGNITAATGAALKFAGTSTTDVTNSGTITATTGIAVDVDGAVTGTLTNSGTITSANVTAAAGTIDLEAGISGGIVNSGLITNTGNNASAATIDINADLTGAITNTGTISATGAADGVAIDVGADATITNSGTITATNDSAIVVAAANTKTITNSAGGTISSTANAGAGESTIQVDAALAALDNSGTITATAGNAIDMNAVAITALTNNAAGVISSGDAVAIDWSSGANVSTITNKGTITSVAGDGAIDITGAAAGTLTNSGTISNTGTGADAAIDVGATLTGAITNSGTITTTGTAGAINFSANADVTGNITNTGTISSTNATAVAIDGSGATGTAVTVTNSGTITGAVKLGEGWTLTNSGTITGNITDGDDGVDTLNWNGGTITGTIDLGSENTDRINVGDATSDSITTGGAITGVDILNVKEGTFNVAHDITLTGTSEDFLVSSGATAKYTTTKTLNALDIDIEGTLNVANGIDLTITSGGAGAVNTTASGNLTFGISKNSDFGQIIATEGTNTTELASGSTITFDVSNGDEMITAGELVDVIAADAITVDGAALTGTTTGLTFSDDSYVLGFALSTNSNGTGLDVTVSRANAYETSSSKANESAVGTALEAIANTGDTGIDAIVGTLDSFATAREVEAALETLNPEMSGAINAAATGAADAGFGVVGNRLEQLAGISGTGVAAGGMSYNHGVWGEVFGTAADQDDRKGVKGYQADTIGFGIGGDTAISEQTKIGASFAYAATEADSANGETEIDSYQLSLYGTHDYGKWFADGLVGFTFNNFDTKRNIVVGSIANQAKGDFDGQQYSLKVGGGYKLDVEGGLNVTPVASLKYDYLALDKYTETGSTASLTVDNEDLHILKSDIGVKLNYPIVDGGMTYIPEISTSWTYDLVGDEQEAKNNFVGASATQFTTKGAKVAQHQFNVGLGLDVLAQDNVTVSFDYDWASKEDYNSHSGAVKARFAF